MSEKVSRPCGDLNGLAELGPDRLQSFLEARAGTAVRGAGDAFFTAPRAQTVRGVGDS
ncbi:thiovarsolin family RiPP, partial [Nocardiopsis halophila]|uniref:thiovarsolin family RiPP n=1 Tax=Nocardiopsis halophila TaxID=141692 RepID=UPI0013783764